MLLTGEPPMFRMSSSTRYQLPTRSTSRVMLSGPSTVISGLIISFAFSNPHCSLAFVGAPRPNPAVTCQA
jgi:hypothetical protein